MQLSTGGTRSAGQKERMNMVLVFIASLIALSSIIVALLGAGN